MVHAAKTGSGRNSGSGQTRPHRRTVAEVRKLRPDHLEKTLDENMQVCPKCGHHFRLDARARLAMLFDEGSYEELDADLVSTDPLHFEDSKTYARRLEAMQQATGLSDALISGAGTLEGRRVQICSMELKFIGGSMGAVVGEKSHGRLSAGWPIASRWLLFPLPEERACRKAQSA